ncbi:DUF2935 domain-containing protein [Thermicanus aegyptius]|uniref:DUF2935 domain-containing protein n=1 Tax=Thermicanus aegyptius TaxID=94009 RepID=UPI0004025413|nr:DUF2935 domain-containing protein [Thermicanus aegyptius]
MSDSAYRQSASFEHRFWLQILGDHSRFIFHSFSPKEVHLVQRAGHLLRTFDALLEDARRSLADEELVSLSWNSLRSAQELRDFKLELIKRHLVGNVSINLPPTFLNHMVNELEEYLRILRDLTIGEVPREVHPVHHHLLWLSDAAGHSATMTDLFDPTEKNVKKKSEQFTQQFEHFYLKAVELAGYLRTHLAHFPALNRFNHDVELEIKLFQTFLSELEELRLNDEALGVFDPLMADHMFREECYYLTKLSQSAHVKQPVCDPAKPRVETE